MSVGAGIDLQVQDVLRPRRLLAGMDRDRVERRAPVGIVRHRQQRPAERRDLRRPLPRPWTDDGRVAHRLRPRHDPRRGRQVGLRSGQRLPYIAVDAARLRQPAAHGAHHVAVAVGEKAAGEEAFGLVAAGEKIRHRHEVAGIAVWVREGVGVAAQVGQVGRRPSGTLDQVGLVERPAPPERHRDERERGPVGEPRIAADPSGIEIAHEREVRGLAIDAALEEPDLPSERPLQPSLKAREKLGIVVQEEGREAEPEGRAFRPEDGGRGEAPGRAQEAAQQLSAHCLAEAVHGTTIRAAVHRRHRPGKRP